MQHGDLGVAKMKKKRQQTAHQQRHLTNGGVHQEQSQQQSQAGSLRALKEAISLCSQKPAMHDVAPQQTTGFQNLLPEADILERLVLGTSHQSPQLRNEDTLKHIGLPMKRPRSTINSDPEKEVCIEAHVYTQHFQQVRKKRKRVDRNQAINRIEESRVQSGLLEQGAPLQAEVVKLKSPSLEEMIAMQENAQDLVLSHHNGKEYDLSKQASSNFEMQSLSQYMTAKTRKKGEKKAKDRRTLPFNTNEEDNNEHCGLLEEDIPGPVQVCSRKEVIANVERAAVEAHGKLLAKGEFVLVARVVLELLRDSNNISLQSLGLCIYDVPYLRRLAHLEKRVNTLILCHLAVRKITTLYDLQREITEVERVKNFHKLRIGHLSQHPLVLEHFSPFMGRKIHNITARDVLNHLWDYLDIDTHQKPSKLQVDDFLSYMVKARSLSSSHDLCVRIQCLEEYASYLVREKKTVMNLLKRVSKFKGTIMRTAQKRVFTKHAHLSHSKTINHSKHMVYLSSDGDEDVKNHKSGDVAVEKEKPFACDSIPYKRCVCPSAAEERLRLLGKVPSKLQQELAGCDLPVQELQAIVTTWSDVCSRFSIEEVLVQMVVKNGLAQETSKKKLLMLFKYHSAATILNIVVKSMKAGLWKSVFDTSEKFSIRNDVLNNNVMRSDKEVFLRRSAEQTDMEELGFSCTAEKQPLTWSEGDVGTECKVDSVTAEEHGFSTPDKNMDEKEAKDVITMIRKEEFGIDPGLPSKQLDLLAKQHARLGRALQCLSQELYSQDSHFILELVQNADDNQYSDGVKPTLVFLLEGQRVAVVNNELGFSSSNIRALCDVGSSTKTGSAAGFIGHKGIGFKSVFCVTDAPEVHSRGYHIKFDISEGKVGFLLPTGIPAISGLESVEKMLGNEAPTEQMGSMWNTQIVLPFKVATVDSPCKQMLSSRLDNIHPSLLLFLRRLQKIIIKNDVTGTLRVLQKCHTKNGLIELSDGTNHAAWLVVKQQLTAVIDCPGIKTTELALALPLREVSSGVYDACYEHQQMFSILPIHSCGLRFIVQGDFTLIASREDLDADSAWNQWLLSEVPMVFVKTLETLKELDCFRQTPGKAASVILSFVPLEGEVKGFFAPLSRMIFTRLRASHCLPVDAEQGGWTFPCALLGAWTKFARRFLFDDLLREHLGLHFLHRDVVINPLTASALGVHIYGSRVLMNLMETLCSKENCLQALGPKWIGSWFAALYKCIVNESENSNSSAQPKFEFEDIEKLKELSCIPLTNGAYTSLKEGTVWLPCIDPGSVVDSVRNPQGDFPLVYSELWIIDTLLWEPMNMENLELDCKNVVESEDNGVLVSSMFQHLGVRQALGHEVMIKHILPSMASDEFLEKPEPFFVQYMAFVMVHLQSDCMLCKFDRASMMLQLQEAAVIATKCGPRKANTTSIHFGLEFDCKVDVKNILKGLKVDWMEVHPAYLGAFQGSSQGELLPQWRQFFENLGVSDFVKVKCHAKKLHDKTDVIWKRVPLTQFKDESSLSVEDWECPELIQIIESLCNSDIDSADRLNKLAEFVTAFDSLWDKSYSKYLASYWSCSENEGPRVKTFPSFALKLRSYAWVQSSFDRKLYKPTQLYYRCSAVESILGMHAPYAVPQIKSMKFAKALGFKMNVSVLDILDLLKMWNGHPFETSLSQMARLYAFLWSETAQSEKNIVPFFQQNECIFVPDETPASSDIQCTGRFYFLNQLIWKDDTGCLAKFLQSKNVLSDFSNFKICPKTLDLLYPTLRGFLVDVCQVRPIMEFDDYLNGMRMLAKHFSPLDVMTEVLAVLCKWSHDIDSHQMPLSALGKLKEVLHSKESPILPTTKNKWVSLHSSPWLVCWCDDEEIGRQFSSLEEVMYVCVSTTPTKGSSEAGGNAQTGQLLAFFKAMDILPLSKVVEREPTICGARLGREMFDLLSWSFPYTQRYLQRWHKDIYEHLQQSSFDIRLKKIQCFHAEQLSFRYKLPGKLGLGSEQLEVDYLLQGEKFYGTTVKNLNSLYFEFSRIYFDGSPNMQLANFLHLITLAFQSGSDIANLEALLSTQGIGPCSELGKQWVFAGSSMDKSQVETGSLKHSAERHHAKEKESKQVQDKLSRHQAKTRKDDKRHSSVVDEVAVYKRFSAIVRNHIEAKDLESKGKQIRKSSATKDAPAVIEEGLGHAGNKSEPFEYVDDAVVSHADGTGGKLCETDPCRNDKVEGSYFIKNSERDSSLLDMKLKGDGADENVQSANQNIFFSHPCKEQALLTGRLGEAIVFNHLMEKYGANHVHWMNAETERGFPYDIVVGKSDGEQLYVKVKATWSANKNWFEISNREWEFAVQAGDKFIITRVFFSGLLGSARFVWLRNPSKLSQDKRIRMALIVP